MDENYSFPVIALKGLLDYQPKDYQFDLETRELFDISKLPKDVKILNGDISEDVAKSQARTLVDQLQSQKAHAKYHMIQSIHTESDVGDVELLHAPIWFAKYDHKGHKIVLVIENWRLGFFARLSMPPKSECDATLSMRSYRSLCDVSKSVSLFLSR